MNITAIPQENNRREDNFDDFSEIFGGRPLPEFGGREAVLGFEKLGTPKEEMAASLGVAISVNAGAALVCLARFMDAVEAVAS